MGPNFRITAPPTFFDEFRRPRSIYQYSNMAPRLSGQTSIFGVIFFVFTSLLGIERQKKLRKFTFFTRKPRSHVRISIYRTSAIPLPLPRYATVEYEQGGKSL